MENRFSGRVVAVTGAAGGIGSATVKLFAGEGAKLVLTGRDREKLTKMAGSLGLNEENCLIAPGNVSSEADVESIFAAAMEKFGRLDVLFNNAGIVGAVSKIEDYDGSSMKEVLEINVLGVFFGMKHALKIMKKQGRGVIINTCSIAGFRGMPDTVGYVASKHAIMGMTRAAASENAAAGIRVCAVCPSPVDTPMMSRIEDGKAAMSGSDPALVRSRLSALPMGRYASPEEVANAVLFLASDDASFISGTPVFVDGCFMA